MGKLKLLLLVLIIALAKNSYAQVSLSDPHPEAGKKVDITYDATGTPLAGKTDVKAKIYYIDNAHYPVDEISLNQKGNVWTGSITPGDSVKAFIVDLKSADTSDNNKGVGYLFVIYKHSKPVKGAYAAIAYAYEMGSYLSVGSKPDLALNAIDQEDALYPSKVHMVDRYMLMMRTHKITAAAITPKIDSLSSTGKEGDLSLAISLSRLIRKTKVTDSLSAIAIAKYPKGETAKEKLEMELYQQKDIAKKDSLYSVFLNNYPADKSTANNMTQLLVVAHLQAADFAGYHKYKSMMTDTSGLDGLYNSVAFDWATKGQHLPEAERLSKESLDLVNAQVADPKSSFFSTADQVKKNDLQNLDYYLDTYAFILYKEGRSAEAAKIEKPVWERAKLDPSISADYVLMLIATGDNATAINILEPIIKAGKGNDDLNADLKKAYIGKNGSDKGFDPYLASLQTAARSSVKSDLAKEMLNIPAPAFVLKDLDGNVVSLADLKGKTVIVDFWATWCGPCKASMPGMQMAVNKYKDDPNVKFLFIDTWENGDDYLPGVKKFISDTKYTFHVLVDEKDDEGKQGKVVGQFGVDGIPTKFFIDKNGIIRFKHIGYDGSPEGLVTDVSNMIEMLK